MNKKRKLAGTVVLCSVLAMSSTISIHAYEKDETVYTTLHEDGSVKEVVVNDHLKAQNEKEIRDFTDLSNVVNVNGDEKFTQTNDTIVWKNNGKDIFYEGTSKKELPIKTSITYSLNGKETTAKKMKGKSGTVEISMKFENLDKHGDLYTPFVITAATILNSKDVKQAEITNGKVIANGISEVMVGIASPGLYESLNQPTSLKEFDHITIRYKTKKFKAQPLYIMATPKLLDETDFDFHNQLNTLHNSIRTLTSASSQLVNGSQELYNGAKEFQTNYAKFHTGLSELAKGSSELSTQYQTLDQGIQSLAKQSDSFANVETLLKQFNKLNEATTALDGGIASLQNALNQSTDPNSTSNQAISAIKQDMLAKQKELQALQTQMSGLQSELTTRYTNLANLALNFDGLIQNEKDEEQKATLVEMKKTLMIETEALKADLTKLAGGMKALDNNLIMLQDDLGKLDEITTKITASTQESLKQAIASFTQGNNQLKKGLKQVQTHTVNLPTLFDQLMVGSKQLAKGSTQVNQALFKLKDASGTLFTFSTQFQAACDKLSTGAYTLATGMKKFDQEGIKQLSKIPTVLQGASDKANGLIKLSNDYRTFTKVDEKVKSDVKFVFMVKPEGK